MVLCGLYRTDNGIVSLDNDKIGDIIVETKDDSYVEALTKSRICCFIKDDQEELYFPQPLDHAYINNSIRQYGFSLYIRDNESINSGEKVNTLLEFYRKNPDLYVFNSLLEEMKEKDMCEKMNVIIKEKIHRNMGK